MEETLGRARGVPGYQPIVGPFLENPLSRGSASHPPPAGLEVEGSEETGRSRVRAWRSHSLGREASAPSPPRPRPRSPAFPLPRDVTPALSRGTSASQA